MYFFRSLNKALKIPFKTALKVVWNVRYECFIGTYMSILSHAKSRKKFGFLPSLRIDLTSLYLRKDLHIFNGQKMLIKAFGWHDNL